MCVCFLVEGYKIRIETGRQGFAFPLPDMKLKILSQTHDYCEMT